MPSVEDVLDVLDRAHNGPVCSEKDWDVKVIPLKVSEKLKEHGLNGVCDPENPVNIDDSLADDFWRAGFELAVDLGMLCTDTERVIRFTEEELKEALRNAPDEISFGKGKDRIVCRNRVPESKIVPAFMSPIGVPVSEELWISVTTAIISLPIIDATQGPGIGTLFGIPVKAGTPYQTLLGRVMAQMSNEAAWRAGRPGIGFCGLAGGMTPLGQFGGFGMPGGLDPEKDHAHLLTPAELKIDYAMLNMVVHAFNCGAEWALTTKSFVGGYPGPPEGSALVSIAYTPLSLAAYLSFSANGNPMDIRYSGNCGREAMWAMSVTKQAVSRNTHTLVDSDFMQVSGPCTDMLLYESAAAMTNAAASGCYFGLGPFSGGCRHLNHLTPLECKFNAEVFKASAGLNRDEANEIAKALIPKYEEKLLTPPESKPVTECYNLKTKKPSKEWLDIYLRVKKELIDLGVPLQNL
jgi:methylamine--corrinoid protein Co-methyltransferase